MHQVTAEQKQSRAWRVVIIAALLAVVGTAAFFTWMFWSLWNYLNP